MEYGLEVSRDAAVEERRVGFLADLQKYTARGWAVLNPDVSHHDNPFDEALKVLQTDPDDYVIGEQKEFEEDTVAEYLFEDPQRAIDVYTAFSGLLDEGPGLLAEEVRHKVEEVEEVLESAYQQHC